LRLYAGGNLLHDVITHKITVHVFTVVKPSNVKINSPADPVKRDDQMPSITVADLYNPLLLHH
jgi:hypothetical protein